ncbi:MAG TPA: hypothetical protein VGQ64_02780 [Candidatus Limnocylindrales bacterium]|jgi:hypothetical protein|nr:hypothetical protein [Candidatus Limnocylindrales bacterium]
MEQRVNSIRAWGAGLFDFLFGGKGRVIFWILVGDLLGFAGGAMLSFGSNVDAPAIALSLLVPTMITFIGLLWIRGMREAIAAGFFILFVSLFVSAIVIDLDAKHQLAKDLAVTFQQLMTTVAAFYFASAAIVETSKVLKGSKHSEAVRDDPPKDSPPAF